MESLCEEVLMLCPLSLFGWIGRFSLGSSSLGLEGLVP